MTPPRFTIDEPGRFVCPHCSALDSIVEVFTVPYVARVRFHDEGILSVDPDARQRTPGTRVTLACGACSKPVTEPDGWVVCHEPTRRRRACCNVCGGAAREVGGREVCSDGCDGPRLGDAP